MLINSTRPRRTKVKIADEIIEALRQEIVTGKLKHGERMPTERELANRFGVSQPTIREVIRALETLGLVDVQHGSGSYIRGQGNYALALALQTILQLESVGIMEVLEVRQILGRKSIELAAANATADDLASIRQSIASLDNIDTAQSVDEVIQRIIEFQRSLSKAAHNPLLHSLEVFLLTLLIQVQVKSLRQRGLRFWRSRALEFKDDRRLINEAMQSRAAKKAGSAMERYFDHLRQRFVEDKTLRKLNLSDPHLVAAVAEMVQQIRTG